MQIFNCKWNILHSWIILKYIYDLNNIEEEFYWLGIIKLGEQYKSNFKQWVNDLGVKIPII